MSGPTRERYKQSIAATGVSLERATSQVPDDGYFYVLLNGEIKGRFRTLKGGQAAYKTLLDEVGYKPPKPSTKPNVDHGKEAVERYLDELEGYWDSSHKHRRRGGKSMYRS